GVLYSMLLAADAAGALIGGIVLESVGSFATKARTVFMFVMIWCVALATFALTPIYAIALVALFIAGFVELSFSSTAQALVQLNAPPEIRGRVIGFYTIASLGLRAFAGVTVGLGGTVIGIHWSLALSGAALFTVAAGMIAYITRAERRQAA